MAEYIDLNNTEVLAEAGENAKLVVEEDGELKRIPASAVGQVKTVNGVEPDEAGNVDVSGLLEGVPVIQSAEVGQTVVVKAVDESGKPTEWEAVDMASGGGVAFIAMNRPTPVVWDASSNQYVELTKDRFIELFNSGVVRVMDADLGDPTKHPSGTSPAQGTVVSYWFNDTVANVGVSGMGTNGYYSGNVAGWV